MGDGRGRRVIIGDGKDDMGLQGDCRGLSGTDRLAGNGRHLSEIFRFVVERQGTVNDSRYRRMTASLCGNKP